MENDERLTPEERQNILDQMVRDVISYPTSYDMKRAGYPQKAEYYWLVPKVGNITLIHSSDLSKYFCAANSTFAAYTMEELSDIIINKK